MRSIRAATTLAVIVGLVGAWPLTGAGAEEAAAPTQSPTPAQVQTQAAAKSEYENRLICKKRTATGSLLSKKTCKTQAQLDAERKDAQRLLNNQRRTGAGSRGTAVISDF
jgi:hypothetical protein